MRFCTTRNKNISCDFKTAILHPIPKDGGFFIPRETSDLRRWIVHIDEKTPFESITGTLLSSFISEEYSPVICDTIATKAFATFRPKIKQLADDLFILELFDGPSATHRDFGITFLCSCFETIFTLEGGKCTFLDSSSGSFGASLGRALRGKTNQRAVIIYPKGCCKGLDQKDLVSNGGNVLPVEIDGTLTDCYNIKKEILLDTDFSYENNVTTANSANIGRLLMQSAFYTYAFAAIKNNTTGGIFYSLDAGNYSAVIAGLYAWSFALPLNGFIIPSTSYLESDLTGSPIVLDSIVPKSKRAPLDPAVPSCVERLEDFFDIGESSSFQKISMMKHFLFPHALSSEDTKKAAISLYKDYGVYSDLSTARAYGAYQKHKARDPHDPYTTILIAKDSPLLSTQFVRQSVGVAPKTTKKIDDLSNPVALKTQPLAPNSAVSEIKALIKSL